MKVTDLSANKLFDISLEYGLGSFDYMADDERNGVHLLPLLPQEWKKFRACFERFGKVETATVDHTNTLFLPLPTLLEMEKWQAN